MRFHHESVYVKTTNRNEFDPQSMTASRDSSEDMAYRFFSISSIR